MTTVVVGNLDFDSDETFISQNIIEVLEGINDQLCDGFVGRAAVDLGNLMDLLELVRTIHSQEDLEFLGEKAN